MQMTGKEVGIHPSDQTCGIGGLGQTKGNLPKVHAVFCLFKYETN